MTDLKQSITKNKSSLKENKEKLKRKYEEINSDETDEFLSKKDLKMFENTMKSKEEIIVDETILMNKEKKQIEEWTRKKCSEVLFDSNKDDWDINTSVFNQRIENKSQFVVED